MDRVCSTHGSFGRKMSRKVITRMTYTVWEVVNWIHLAQNRDQWWTLVNIVMNLRIKYCKFRE
jgi:hypothetical protein